MFKAFLEEKDFVPYQTSPLPSGPWLVLAPHPDDESIGLGGTLALAADIPVLLVVVTDGSLGGPSPIRYQETLQAAKVLHLEEVIFWNLPDRKVYQKFDLFAQKFLSLLKQCSFQTIFLPQPFEYHPDHRAVSLYSLILLEEIRFSNEIWFYEISRQAEINRLINISKVWSLKEKAIKCYRSQLRINNYLDIVRSLNKARTYSLPADVSYAEGFWVSKAEKALSSFGKRFLNYFSFESY